jgi:hypothetical protein
VDRQEFIAHLRAGRPATEGVRQITGVVPEIVTIASLDEKDVYIRYGVMMAGPLMAAIVILRLYPETIPEELMTRIKEGESCGAVLTGMERRGRATGRGLAVQAFGSIIWKGKCVGSAIEVFTESLFKKAYSNDKP